MHVTEAKDPQAWDAFLAAQQFRPFLQSWAMGEVYKAIGHPPVRLQVEENGEVIAICFGHIVPARRGRHVSIPYGPVFSGERITDNGQLMTLILDELKKIAKAHKCSFIRMSPFWPVSDSLSTILSPLSVPSPLHLLGEHIWYLPLTTTDVWTNPNPNPNPISPDDLFKNFRATHRNLIRRAEKEGVTITASDDPVRDLPFFITLHDETRKRHGFTPYTNSFFKAQVVEFAQKQQCTLYLAHYQGEVIAASIHMHTFGETSYHHGASTHRHRNIPASYLLQWTAIKDALKRGDQIYSFWGIAPLAGDGHEISDKKHPFAGVTLFKTGFSGNVLNLLHCRDIPVSSAYWLTNVFEKFRKWRRGF